MVNAVRHGYQWIPVNDDYDKHSGRPIPSVGGLYAGYLENLDIPTYEDALAIDASVEVASEIFKFKWKTQPKAAEEKGK